MLCYWDDVRAVNAVGLYEVTWMWGVSAALEREVTVYLLRYPMLLSPGTLHVSVASDATARGALFRTLRRDFHRKLIVGSQWDEIGPQQREYDFIMSMLLEKLALEGRLTFEHGALRLRQEDEVLSGDSVAAHLNDRASQLFEAYS